MNETIKQNNPRASDKAIPKIEYENNWSFNEGFLLTPLINAAKTIAIPIPAPNNPIRAIPAPIYLAANTNCILIISIVFNYLYIYMIILLYLIIIRYPLYIII